MIYESYCKHNQTITINKYKSKRKNRTVTIHMTKCSRIYGRDEKAYTIYIWPKILTAPKEIQELNTIPAYRNCNNIPFEHLYFVK